MKAISIIITTIKDKVLTLDSLGHCPVQYEVIISKKNGLGFARNWGAEQAKNDLLVFLMTIYDLETKYGQKSLTPKWGSSR